MSNHDQIRKDVSDVYAGAVSSETEGGPCCCSSSPVQKGVAAKMAGYSREELAAIPPEAVVNSFGCGNPLALSGVAEGDVVLDLGSGAGIDVLLAGKLVGPAGRAIGIDMTEEMLAKARGNIEAAGLDNVEVRKGIIEDLPVDSGTVDWVISNCVINLSPEKNRVFTEIARVLKPGGTMLVSDIVVKDLPGWVRQSAELYSSCVAGAISEEEYLAGLRDVGLVDVEVVDRLYYDASQLAAFVDSEEAGCCNTTLTTDVLKRVVPSLEGKVWSAKVRARKPLS